MLSLNLPNVEVLLPASTMGSSTTMVRVGRHHRCERPSGHPAGRGHASNLLEAHPMLATNLHLRARLPLERKLRLALRIDDLVPAFATRGRQAVVEVVIADDRAVDD